MTDSLGAHIRTARIEMGLTQKALAELAEVDQGMVSRYETGAVVPTPATLAKLCSTLELPFHELIGMTL